MDHADELHNLEAQVCCGVETSVHSFFCFYFLSPSFKALHDTEKTKALLKEIAALSGTVKTLTAELETEREKRQELEARLAVLEAKRSIAQDL